MAEDYGQGGKAERQGTRMGGKSALKRELVGGKDMLCMANSRGCLAWLQIADEVARKRDEE
jgi:hypothetical protein